MRQRFSLLCSLKTGAHFFALVALLDLSRAAASSGVYRRGRPPAWRCSFSGMGLSPAATAGGTPCRIGGWFGAPLLSQWILVPAFLWANRRFGAIPWGPL